MSQLSRKKRFEILQRDEFRCQYCGRGGTKATLHVDHVEPVSLGGSDEKANLVTACRSCNLGKSDSPLGEEPPARRTKPLVGKFFHKFMDDDRTNAKQGKVVSHLGEGELLCQFFSWIDGRPTQQKVLVLEDLSAWNFYEDQDEWMHQGGQILRP